MRIITNFEAMGISEESIEALRETPAAPCAKAEVKTWVFQALNEAFNDQTSDPETYLYDSTDDKNFIFGALAPEKVIETAKDWNQEIKKAFITALGGLGDPDVTADNLPMDNDKTYKLSCAARELDNVWWQHADHCVYLPNPQGFPYFRCILPDECLEDIINHPEQYVIVDVYVKD